MLKGALKIVQAVHEPGYEILIHMEGLGVVVRLDAIKLKTEAGRPSPGRWTIRTTIQE